jgi:hypothetical protein
MARNPSARPVRTIGEEARIRRGDQAVVIFFQQSATGTTAARVSMI